MIVKIVADVVCTNPEAENTNYRLYIDDDLYTERTFRWDSKITYIEENSFSDLEPGGHSIRLVSCQVNNGFELRNITVDGESVSNMFTIKA